MHPPLFLATILLSLSSLLAAAPAPAPTILEGESLKILQKSGTAAPQDLKPYGDGAWSGNAHLWWTGASPGDVLELALPIPATDTYHLAAGLTKAIDYGIFEFSLDGQPLAGPIDCFHNGVIHTGTIPLGKPIALSAGEHRLAIRITAANPAALKGYMLGLDYLVAAPVSAGPVTSLGPKLRPANPPVPANPPPLKTGNADAAPALTPAAQLATFSLPDGFIMELVASEESGLPKPVMATFDDHGRLWSLTATAYPRDQDPGVWDQPGPDRIVVIDQPLTPGPHKARTFADGMVMPMSVLPHRNGAFVAQGPEILFLEDTNNDGRADSRKSLVKGFGIQDTHTLPHQLTRMPGNRIVYSQGVLNNGRITDASGRAFDFNKTLIASMKPDGSDTRIIGAGLNNIWAWAHSRSGRVFFHEANDLGYSVVLFEEDSSYPSFIDTRLHPDAPLHPPTAEGLDLGGTGFSGMAFADDRSGSFPTPWQGLLCIANPILGKIHAVRASLNPNGVWKFEKSTDLVSSADPMFRPVAITFGPDGCLYITDWYNRIISHNEIARDHPARDKEHGRIWRVRHTSQSRRTAPDIAALPSADLPARLRADNTWEMRAAWHQIADRQATETIPALSAILTDPTVPDDSRIHALWALEELGHFNPDIWSSLLAHASPDVRRESIRALSSLRVPEDTIFSLLQPLADEPSWSVRYEILRCFRRAPGPVNPTHIAWLQRWSASPAPTTKVNGWNGSYLALGGPYEHAFQAFLLNLASTKSTPALVAESPWDKTIDSVPPPDADSTAKTNARIATIKATLPSASPTSGQPLVSSICLTCHAIAGKGVGFAPPLDGSSKRDLDGLITAIIAPDAATEHVFRLYRITRKDGSTIEGFKRSETSRDITILSMGGASSSIPIADIKSAGYINGKSVMPNLAAAMPDADVAAIVKFLQSVK
jgi:putative membrane-bound dehydrogenase-like protein